MPDDLTLDGEVADEAENAIAIVGMSGRFPGARSVEELWEVLTEGREVYRHLSDEHLRSAGVDECLLEHPSFVKISREIDEVFRFDAEFFGISPREASLTDPQHRLFLECAWEALESAGHVPERFEGRIGVFAGATLSTYLLHHLRDETPVIGGPEGLELILANSLEYLATRVCYKLDLSGPGVSLGTACSTSMVAVHLACDSLLSRQCDMVLAGGVGLVLPQDRGYLHLPGSIWSPDGRCRPFDARAEGTAFGNGLAIVVLRRLVDAVADRDHIHAVIRGSAVNNDGASKVGFAAPGLNGQMEVVAEAMAVADVDPESIGYVEAHGTGTPMGDSLEVAALGRAFRESTERLGFCALGSLKGNIGHLDAAAGVAAVIKAALAVEHGVIPPTVNFESPNPDLDLDNSPFYVNRELERWTGSDGGPRRAAASSFGVGGTNAHVVLEQAPAIGARQGSRESQLLPLSARTETALDRTARRLSDHLRQNRNLDLADVAYTLCCGRRAFERRRTVVVADREHAVAALAADAPSDESAEGATVAFLFGGSTGWDSGVDSGLWRDVVFRTPFEECRTLFAKHGLGGVLGVPDGADRPSDERTPDPTVFALQYATARSLIELGAEPAAVLGHGVGEYAAACVAGVLELEEVVDLLAQRRRAAVGGGRIPQEKVDRVVPAPGRAAPGIRFASTAAGGWVDATTLATADYWASERLEGTQVAASLESFAESAPILVEIDPGRRWIESPEQPADSAPLVVRPLGGPEAGSDLSCYQTALGQLWCAGVEIDWDRYWQAEKRRPVPLPTYPFEGRDFCVQPSTPRPGVVDASAGSAAEAVGSADLLALVSSMLGEALGIEDLGPDDDFFALGGESLQAVRVLGRLSTRLGRTLPLTALVQAPTPRQLVDLLDEPAEDLEVDFVELKKGGERPPLFLAQGLGGGVGYAADVLARLQSDRPVFGMTLRSYEPLLQDFPGIEDTARLYVEALGEFWPDGPYLLAGYSYGGLLAYEIACQLQQIGREVDLLAILDTGPTELRPLTRLEVLRSTPSILAGLPHWIREDMLRTSPGLLLERARKKLLSRGPAEAEDVASDTAAPGDDLDSFLDRHFEDSVVATLSEGARRHFAGELRATAEYRPGTYAGRVTLFRARRRKLIHSSRSDLGWGDCVEGTVDVVVVPGSHDDLLEGTGAIRVARELDARL